MIRVLTDNHHLHLVKRTEVEGIEDEVARREAQLMAILLAHGIGEAGEVWHVKLLAQILLPGWFYVDVHNRDGAINFQEVQKSGSPEVQSND